MDDGEAFFFFLNEGRVERREKSDKVGTDNRFLWGKGKKEVLEEGKRIIYISIFFLFRFAALARLNCLNDTIYFFPRTVWDVQCTSL